MVLSGHKQEGLERVEEHPHNAPSVLPEGVLGGMLGQLMHQHSLCVTCTLPPTQLLEPRHNNDGCMQGCATSVKQLKKQSQTPHKKPAGLQFAQCLAELTQAWLLATKNVGYAL